METLKIKGIIIRSIDYKETSKIVYCITSIGKLSVRALGTKSYKNKNFNFNEILSYVEMEITDSEFPSLIDYNVINSFDNIKNDLKSYLWMGYLCEFLNKLPNDIPSERVFNYLVDVLHKINNYKTSFLVAMMTQIKFLPLFGIKPNMTECVICGAKPTHISVKHGGGVCTNHKEKEDILIDDILKLYNFDIKNNDLSSLENIDLNMVLNFVTHYYKYHEDLELKSLNSIIF